MNSYDLIKLAKNDDMVAKKMVIDNNIKLIYKIIHEVSPIFKFPSVTFNDLVQE